MSAKKSRKEIIISIGLIAWSCELKRFIKSYDYTLIHIRSCTFTCFPSLFNHPPKVNAFPHAIDRKKKHARRTKRRNIRQRNGTRDSVQRKSSVSAKKDAKKAQLRWICIRTKLLFISTSDNWNTPNRRNTHPSAQPQIQCAHKRYLQLNRCMRK